MSPRSRFRDAAPDSSGVRVTFDGGYQGGCRYGFWSAVMSARRQATCASGTAIEVQVVEAIALHYGFSDPLQHCLTLR